MKNIRKNTKLIFLLVLPVYFFIVQNSLLNKHTHFYPNGIVITHSHPVDHDQNKPINDHNHTKTEICLYQSLQFEFFRVSPELVVVFGNNNLITGYISFDFISDYNSTVLASVSRGPPYPVA